MIRGITEQKIVQGKTYSLRLKFKSEDVEKISKMWFTCQDLKISQEMELDAENNIYSFGLTWQQTQALETINTTFNITVQFIGAEEKRDLANGIPLTVAKNKNPVREE